MLLADLDQVDRPRESRLVEVRRVAGGDGHAPHGIEPALDFVVHVLAAHDLPSFMALRPLFLVSVAGPRVTDQASEDW